MERPFDIPLRAWNRAYKIEASHTDSSGNGVPDHNLVEETARAILEEQQRPKPIKLSNYDRGRRDMLNAILSPNPEVARKLHDIRGDEGVEFTNIHGKLSFDLVFWVTAVAEQLGIEPKEVDSE